MATDHSPGDPVSALAPTGQGAGGVTSRENASAAPGSAPAAVNAGDKFPVVAREVDVTAYDGRQLEHGEGEPPGRSWDDLSGRRQPWGPS